MKLRCPDGGIVRLRRSISPGLVFLAIALIGSVVFALYAISVRDASQIPLLAAGGVALGIVFLALAGYTLRATWRAGLEARNGRALALGVGGGIGIEQFHHVDVLHSVHRISADADAG